MPQRLGVVARERRAAAAAVRGAAGHDPLHSLRRQQDPLMRVVPRLSATLLAGRGIGRTTLHGRAIGRGWPRRVLRILLESNLQLGDALLQPSDGLLKALDQREHSELCFGRDLVPKFLRERRLLPHAHSTTASDRLAQAQPVNGYAARAEP